MKITPFRLLGIGIAAIVAVDMVIIATTPRIVINHFDLQCDTKPSSCVGGYLAMGYGYSRFAGPQTLKKVVFVNPSGNPAYVNVREVSLDVMNGGAFVYPNKLTERQWVKANSLSLVPSRQLKALGACEGTDDSLPWEDQSCSTLGKVRGRMGEPATSHIGVQPDPLEP